MKQRNLRLENKKNSNLKLISSTIKNLSKKGINELHFFIKSLILQEIWLNAHSKKYKKIQ